MRLNSAPDIGAAILRVKRESDAWLESLFELMEVVRGEGGVAIAKADGERTEPDELPFTFILSRGRLGDGHLRRDDETLSAAASWCFQRYFTKDRPSPTSPS